MLKETNGAQTVYRLRMEELDEALGEAVVSQSLNELRLHGIFVKPRFRGRGYGKLIMKAVLRDAQAERVTLCTGLGNVSFFKRFGFKVVATGESLVFMEKSL
jgi:predicted N-acetyltransferase YhbS